MKVGITGGSGFIGQYIIEELIESEKIELVRILDIKEPKYKGKFEFIHGDIRDENVVNEFCIDLDWIIHLAAEHHDFGVKEEEYFDVNVNGTQKLVKVMGTHDVKNLIFYSSVAIYGTKNLPADENSQPAPESAYGASKLAAEDCIIKWLAEQKERIAFIVRPTVVIGARNTANMYSLIDQIYRGRYKFHFGKGDNIKSLAFVRSLVSFTLNLMMNNWKKSNQYEIFNYIDYPQLTIGQTIDIIHAELGIKQPRLRLPLSFAISIGKLFDFIIMLTGQNLPISSARIKKISMSTHFEPSKVKKMGFMKQDFVVDGLKEMIEWYLSMKNSG